MIHRDKLVACRVSFVKLLGILLLKVIPINFATRFHMAVSPPRHQILRIARGGMIDDVISHDK